MTAAEKFIEEVRVVMPDRTDRPEQTLDCIEDALEAYDATMTETADDQPEKPQE
jgi:hypothetical protein